MNHPTRKTIIPTIRRDWRQSVGNVLLIIGLVLVSSVLLARLKIHLAADLQGSQIFLEANLNPQFPLPPTPEKIIQPEVFLTEPTPIPNQPPIPENAPVNSQAADESVPLANPITVPEASEIALQEIRSGHGEAFLPVILAQENNGADLPPSESEPNKQYQKIGSGPIVRLVIPSLNIDRAVIDVGLKKNSSQLTWNTDVLFSTSNRPDLVGHASTSVNPGDGGNIILIGHNYNNGWYSPEGVFVNLQQMKQGSIIRVFTEDGGDYQYEVKLVKKVPWSKQNGDELEKHHKYLWPTESEQLTLVTCGGANFGIWSARVYVVAVPVQASPEE